MALEGLQKIRWDRLIGSNGYRVGEHLLNALHELSSPELQERALVVLHKAILYDGFIQHATSYTIPFLIELLEDQAVPTRFKILQFLKSVADAPPRSRGNVSNEEAYHQWGKRVRRAFLKGYPVFVRLLDDDELCLPAAELIARISERFDDSEPVLRARIMEKPVLIHPLIRLWEHQPLSDERKAMLLQWMRDSTLIPHIRTKAALALIKLAGEGYFDETLALFDETIEAREWFDIPKGDYRRQVLTMIFKTLLPVFPQQALEWVVRYRDDWSPNMRSQVIYCLRDLVRMWRWGAKAIEQHFIDLLESDDEGIRNAALNSFSPSPEIAEKLRADKSQLVQQTLERILKRESPRHVRQTYAEQVDLTALLRELLIEWEWNIAEIPDVLYAIGQRKNPHTLPFLKRLLRHDSLSIQVYAARSMWEIDRNTAETIRPVLMEALADCPYAVIDAVECLAEMRERAAIPRLKQIIVSERRLARSVALDEQLQEAAKRALEIIERG